MSDGIPGLRPAGGGPMRLNGLLALGAALVGACLSLSACQRGTSASGAAAAPAEATAKTDAATARSEAEAKDGAAGVTLTPEQIAKLGLVTETAKTVDYLDEAPGYGVVMSHEAIAQAAAELATAHATERMSRSALARAQKLSGTPGAVSADVEETAAQKAQIDAAALALTSQKLSSVLGTRPPWKLDENDPTLRDLSSGKIKLVRATVPFGAVGGGGAPKRLRAGHMGTSNLTAPWTLTTIWDAPADATIPGRSFFALLKGSDASEGEHLQVWVSTGQSEAGVLVPAGAAVLSDSKFWCYLERKPGTFTRVEIDTSRASAAGYFVTDGVVAGDKIVTTAAGRLLAKETGSSAESD